MLLLYCMTEPETTAPEAGVREAKIRFSDHNGIRLFWSSFTPDPASIKEDALVFHRSNSDIFQRQAIIPFRFPTTVTDEAAVHAFLTKHAVEYRQELARLSDYVQMDVIISEPREQTVAASSGTEYLKLRQSEMHASGTLLKQIQSASPAKEWKQSRRPGTIKLSALVKRGEENRFRDEVVAVTQQKARITGPWPPAEFVNCYPEAE